MNAVRLQLPARHARASKKGERGCSDEAMAAAVITRSRAKSMKLPLQSAFLDALANPEFGYAAVVEGVEEFLDAEERRANGL